MLQRLSRKYTDDTVTAGAIKLPIRSRAAKGPWNLNIHPFDELAFFVEYIDVTVASKYVNLRPLNCDSDEDLELNLGKVDRLCLNNWRRFLVRFTHIRHASLLV